MAHSLMSAYLQVGLLNAPVKVYKATEDAKSTFHLHHGKCSGRINMQVFCAVCSKTVARDELVKGYQETKDGPLIIVSADALKQQEIRDQIIEVVQFVPPEALDPRRLTGDSYFLGCDKKLPQDPFRLLLRAMADEDKLALAKFRYSGRERMVLISADRDAFIFIMQPLYYDAELRGSEEIPRPEPKAPDHTHLTLASKLIAQMSAKTLDMKAYRDEYEQRVKTLIAKAKESGGESPIPAQGGQVVDLMAALKASIEKGLEKKPAKGKGKKVA